MTDPTPADIPSLVAEKLLALVEARQMGGTVREGEKSGTAARRFHAANIEIASFIGENWPIICHALDALSPKEDAVGGGEADIKLFVTELLSHRGERPWRVLKGGQELWETWVPAVKAAFAAAPPTPAVEGIPAGMVAWTVRDAVDEDGIGDGNAYDVLLPTGEWLGCIAIDPNDARRTIQEDWKGEQITAAAYTPQARPTASDGEAREHALRVANDAAALAHQPALASAGVRKALQRCADAILAALPTTDGAARLMADIDRLFDLHGDARCDECGAPLFNEDETTTDEAETVALCAGHREAGAPIYAYRIATPPTTDGQRDLTYYREHHCICTASERYVESCPKHGRQPTKGDKR